MKLSELFKSKDDYHPRDRDLSPLEEEGRDVEELKREIEANNTPTVRNAGGVRDGWAWGDLKQLGWAKQHQEQTGRNYFDVWWEYLGPNPIKLVTSGGQDIIMSTGDSTDPVEVDYS